MIKKTKSQLLAPIAVKILVCRGSAHKIETESGTISPKMPNLSATEFYLEIKLRQFLHCNSWTCQNRH